MAFQPGQSGNPAGRPKGIKDRRTMFRDMVEPHAPELVSKAVSMALEGNESMLKLLLDRLLPVKPKEDPIQISLNPESLLDQSKMVIKDLSTGTISVSDARSLMSTIVTESKIVETEYLIKEVKRMKEELETFPSK